MYTSIHASPDFWRWLHLSQVHDSVDVKREPVHNLQTFQRGMHTPKIELHLSAPFLYSWRSTIAKNSLNGTRRTKSVTVDILWDFCLIPGLFASSSQVLTQQMLPCIAAAAKHAICMKVTRSLSKWSAAWVFCRVFKAGLFRQRCQHCQLNSSQSCTHHGLGTRDKREGPKVNVLVQLLNVKVNACAF